MIEYIFYTLLHPRHLMMTLYTLVFQCPFEYLHHCRSLGAEERFMGILSREHAFDLLLDRLHSKKLRVGPLKISNIFSLFLQKNFSALDPANTRTLCANITHWEFMTQWPILRVPIISATSTISRPMSTLPLFRSGCTSPPNLINDAHDTTIDYARFVSFAWWFV